MYKDRLKFIEQLKKLKKAKCCYNADYQKMCDCKFTLDSTSIEEIKHPTTEYTGCCEISILIYLLDNIKNEDYNRIMKL